MNEADCKPNRYLQAKKEKTHTKKKYRKTTRIHRKQRVNTKQLGYKDKKKKRRTRKKKRKKERTKHRNKERRDGKIQSN